MELRKSAFVLLLLCSAVSSAWAADGKALYAGCTACHGGKGEGNRALGAPNIAGMDAWYVKKQLDGFSAGHRGSAASDIYGRQMRAMVGTVPAAERANLAAYIAKMPRTAAPALPKPAAKANLGNGSTQYNALCSACHGAGGKGNQALGAPRLSGVDGVYLARQLNNFKTGLRGKHPDDKAGKQMAAISRMLPDAAAERDVLAYINTLKP